MNQPDDLSPIRLDLKPLAGDVPVAIRLRKLLKVILRSLGFRCTYCGPVPVPASQERNDPCPKTTR